jgi:GntR family transcriptional regulator
MAKEPPAYLRVAADIRAQIAAGELQPGDRIPPVAQLAEQYGLNVTSIRSAISVLQTEGLIDSRQGSGRFVKGSARIVRRAHARSMRNQAGSTSPFARDVAATGGTARWDHQSERTTATPRIAERLGIQAGDPVMRTKYKYLADERPIQVADSHEPLAITSGTPVEWPEDGAAVGVVARMDLIGVNPTRFTEDVICRPATPGESEALELNPRGGQWVMVIERTYYAGELAIEVADIVFPGDRYLLHYEIDLDPVQDGGP